MVTQLGEQTGIPVVTLDSGLTATPDAYRLLGKILGAEDRGNELADYAQKTLDNISSMPGQMAAVLEEALQAADIAVVNAGSSKGEEDFSTRLLRGAGTFLFHGVRAVPGKPLSIALVGNTPVLNLPGPPVAAFNAADWCLRAVVSRFLQTQGQCRPRVKAVLTAPLDGPLPLRFTSRMNVFRNGDAVCAAPVHKEQSSTAETMLARMPQTGYSIKKWIEGEYSHFWQESFGQIYPTLKALVAERLAVCPDHGRQPAHPPPDFYRG